MNRQVCVKFEATTKCIKMKKSLDSLNQHFHYVQSFNFQHNSEIDFSIAPALKFKISSVKCQ